MNYDAQSLSAVFELVGASGLFGLGLALSENVQVLSGFEHIVATFALFAIGVYATATLKSLENKPLFLAPETLMTSGLIMMLVGIGMGALVAYGQFSAIAAILTVPISGFLFYVTIGFIAEIEQKDTEDLREFVKNADADAEL